MNSFLILAAAAISVESAGDGASMQSWVLLVVYLLIALVFSFLCSVAEAAMLKVNRGFIDSIRDRQATAARVLDRFQKSPEKNRSLRF